MSKLKLADNRENELKRQYMKSRIHHIANQLLDIAEMFDKVVFLIPDKERSVTEIRKEANKKIKEMGVKYGNNRRRIRE